MGGQCACQEQTVCGGMCAGIIPRARGPCHNLGPAIVKKSQLNVEMQQTLPQA